MWLVFAMVFGLMLSNYMSRQVVTAVFPFLKALWGLSDTQLGSLVSIVALTVGVLTVPISLLVDRHGRVIGATLMALVWSAATIVGGMAASFMLLLLARILLGVAQAGFGSAGGAILLGVFPPRLHSTVMGAFLAAGLFGSVLGVALGGLVASSYGWRSAFFVIGAIGLLLAVLFRLVVREARQSGAANAEPAPSRMALGEVVRALFSARTAIYLYLGCGLQMFTVGATLAWIPSFLNRYYGMDPGEAGLKAGMLVLVSAVGMSLGGGIVDWLSRAAPGRKLGITAGYAGGTTLLFIIAFSLAPGAVQMVLITLGMFLSGAHSGPSTAIATEVNDPRIRATVMATVALAISLLGMAPGPFITGLIADSSSLQQAMTVMPAASLLACLSFLLARRHYAADAKRFQTENSSLE